MLTVFALVSLGWAWSSGQAMEVSQLTAPSVRKAKLKTILNKLEDAHENRKARHSHRFKNSRSSSDSDYITVGDHTVPDTGLCWCLFPRGKADDDKSDIFCVSGGSDEYKGLGVVNHCVDECYPETPLTIFNQSGLCTDRKAVNENPKSSQSFLKELKSAIEVIGTIEFGKYAAKYVYDKTLSGGAYDFLKKNKDLVHDEVDKAEEAVDEEPHKFLTSAQDPEPLTPHEEYVKALDESLGMDDKAAEEGLDKQQVEAEEKAEEEQDEGKDGETMGEDEDAEGFDEDIVDIFRRQENSPLDWDDPEHPIVDYRHPMWQPADDGLPNWMSRRRRAECTNDACPGNNNVVCWCINAGQGKLAGNGVFCYSPNDPPKIHYQRTTNCAEYEECYSDVAMVYPLWPMICRRPPTPQPTQVPGGVSNWRRRMENNTLA